LNFEWGGVGGGEEVSIIRKIDNIFAVSTAKHQPGRSAFPLDVDNHVRAVFVFQLLVFGVNELCLWCVLNPVIELCLWCN
jgi:hypothetical protein